MKSWVDRRRVAAHARPPSPFPTVPAAITKRHLSGAMTAMAVTTKLADSAAYVAKGRRTSPRPKPAAAFPLAVPSLLLLATILTLFVASGSHALEVTFPAGSGSHWVSCKFNVLQWSGNSTDPEYFSVQLLNANEVRCCWGGGGGGRKRAQRRGGAVAELSLFIHALRDLVDTERQL